MSSLVYAKYGPGANPDAIADPNLLTPPASFALSPSGAAAGLLSPKNNNNVALGTGLRTVLFCDSMTANYNEAQTSTTATYNPVTGVLTYPSTNHNLLTGMSVQIYCLQEPVLAGSLTVTVTRVDANTLTIQLAPGLALSINITNTIFMCYTQWISSKGWFTWFNILSGNRFNVVRNSAQDGDTTGNMVARLQATCLALNPQVVAMQIGGINDFGAAVSDETVWANQKFILEAITAQAICICLTTTPVAPGHALATQQAMARVLRIRLRLLEYARNNPRLILVDAYSKIVDPTSTIGAALGTGVLLGDFIHYSPIGAYLVGAYAWSIASASFPGPASGAVVSAADNYPSSALTLTSVSRTNNVITATLASHGFLAGEKLKVTGGSSEVLNELATVLVTTTNTFTWASVGVDGAIPGTIIAGRNANLLQTPLLLVATGGTVSGANNSGVAAANVKTNQSGTWGTGGTIVSSVVANPNGYGNNQQLVITPGTVSVASPTAFMQVALSNTLLPYMKAGRSYYFECEITIAGVAASTLTELKARLIFTIDGFFPEITVLKAIDNVAASMPDGTYNVRTPAYVLPAGNLTAVQWEIDAKFNAVSAAAVTLSAGRFKVVEVDSI